MPIKLTRSGEGTCDQLVESFRGEPCKSRQRTVATLGRVNARDGQVDSLLNGPLRAKCVFQPIVDGASTDRERCFSAIVGDRGGAQVIF